jgi:hypothetical protein
MALTASLVGTTNTTVYTSSGNNAVTCMMVCNYSVASTTLSLYAVPNSGGAVGTASNTNKIVSALSIPAGETVTLDQEKLVLAGNDTIVAIAGTTTSLNIVISTLPV